MMRIGLNRHSLNIQTMNALFSSSLHCTFTRFLIIVRIIANVMVSYFYILRVAKIYRKFKILVVIELCIPGIIIFDATT